MNKQRKRALSLVAILMAAAGLLAGGVLLQQRTELRRKAAYSNIDVSLYPQPLEICEGEVGKILVKVDPRPENAPETAEIQAAELRFQFDNDLVSVDQLSFHQDYGASIWIPEIAEQGEIRLSALTMKQTVPTDVFDLVEISFIGQKQGEFQLKLQDYDVGGVRYSDDVDVDRGLEINNPEQVVAQIKVVDCGDVYPDCFINDMAEDLSISKDKIGVVENTNVDWPTSCLGCPEADEVCAQVITPGKKLVLESVRLNENESNTCWRYEYHTGLDSNEQGSCDNYRLCNKQEFDCEGVGWPEMTFQIKFEGTEYEAGNRQVIISDIPDQTVDVTVAGQGHRQVYQDIVVSFDDQAVGTGGLTLIGITPGDNYSALIKGPVHLARRFCWDNQTDYCRLDEGSLTLSSGENGFDWTGLRLKPGDINRDGKVNAADYTLLKAALGKRGRNVSEDLNRNGIVNTQDIVFFLETLSTRYGDEI